MLTCFIRNNFIEDYDHINKQYAIYCILAIPIIYVIYTFIKFVKVCTHNKLKPNSDMMKFVKKYILYSFLYIVFYAPPIVLYIVTTNKTITKGHPLGWFSFSSVWCTILFNFVLCFLRIFMGYQNFSWKAIIPCLDIDEDESIRDSLNSQTEILINKRPKGSIYNRLYDETVTGVNKFLF